MAHRSPLSPTLSPEYREEEVKSKAEHVSSCISFPHTIPTRMTEQPQHDDARSDEDHGEQLVLTSPEEARTPKEMGLWAGVILLVALTVYSPALRGDFLWDDDRHVSQNRNLRDAS